MRRPLDKAHRYLLPFLPHDLRKPYVLFLRVTRPPFNLKCLLLVSIRAVRLFRDLPESWQDLPPFREWQELFWFLVANRHAIRTRFGHQIGVLGGHQKRRAGRWRNPLHGIKGEAPLYVNLSMRHEDPALRTRFGALQLQLIYFHWLKIETFRKAHPDHVGEIREGRRRDPEEERDIKQADGAARAARSFQPRDLSSWLSSLDTTCDPQDFPGSLIGSRPQGGDARTFHDRIELYCDARYLPGPGGAGGSRQRLIGQYLNLVDYMGRRYGMDFDVIGGGERDDDDQKTIRQEHILGRRKPGTPHKHIDRKSIIKLGLEPLELADGDPAILENIPPKTARHEAIEGARARSRGFEVDRRLFPFNSQAMRLQEFQDLIVPALKEIARDLSSSTENLVAAAAIAISAETGRSLKELLRLLIEPRLTSSFSFMPPSNDERCGLWRWNAIHPPYNAELKVDKQFDVDRRDFLVYPASEIVTDLIARLVTKTPPPEGLRLFPYKMKVFRGNVTRLLRKLSGERRFTIARISQLIWTQLHVITGGELASACLVLGFPQQLAQVELFYAILEVSKAEDLFARTSACLWNPALPAHILPPDLVSDPDKESFVGCRAFPRLDVTRGAVAWLSDGSRAFFGIRAQHFDPTSQAKQLNQAVIYAVWHQFFSFGTRAIISAYQPVSEFSELTGVGVLSDKDFESGYKTRLVWARPKLLAHMKAVERRLAELHYKFPGCNFSDLGPVWLLDGNGQPEMLTPTAIKRVMNKEFPFPVNTPRKVMRYWLRRAGMSHAHAEAYMGHWWHGREPFSPVSSFNFGPFLTELKRILPGLLEDQLGFVTIPGVRSK